MRRASCFVLLALCSALVTIELGELGWSTRSPAISLATVPMTVVAVCAARCAPLSAFLIRSVGSDIWRLFFGRIAPSSVSDLPMSRELRCKRVRVIHADRAEQD